MNAPTRPRSAKSKAPLDHASLGFRLSNPIITKRLFGPDETIRYEILISTAQQKTFAKYLNCSGKNVVSDIQFEQPISARPLEVTDILEIIDGKTRPHPWKTNALIFDATSLEAIPYAPKSSSAKIDGLPSDTCAALLKKFGADFVSILTAAPSLLSETTRYSTAKIEIILAAVAAEVAARKGDGKLSSRVVNTLRFAGETLSKSRALAKAYDRDASVYQFLYSGKQSFLKADRFAFAFDAKGLASERSRAIVIDTLIRRAEMPGDSIVPLDDLCEAAWTNFQQLRETTIEALSALKTLGFVEDFSFEKKDLFGTNNVRLFGFAPIIQAERRIAAFIADNPKTALKGKSKAIVDRCIANAADLLNRPGFVLDPEQASAVRRIFEHKVSVITGPPGSGKTAILAIANAASRLLFPGDEDHIRCVALSGRAASIASSAAEVFTGDGEVIEFKASTIHRAFGMDPECGDDNSELAGRKEISCGAFISEESSMTNSLLTAHLVKAAHAKHYVFVGDVNQLPPIGAGKPFADLIEGDALPITRLSGNYRTDNSGIRTLCADILAEEGEPPDELADDLGWSLASYKKGVSYIAARFGERGRIAGDLWRELNEHSVDNADIVVLTPANVGDDGTRSLNIDIRKTLGFGPRVEPGDLLLVTKNNYAAASLTPGEDGEQTDCEIFNGERGVVTAVGPDTLDLLFAARGRRDERHVRLLRAEVGAGLPEHTAFGYAMTVHKAQGSQFAQVILVTARPTRFVSKSSVYTSVSRAIDHLTIVGDVTELFRCAGRADTKRTSALPHLITKKEV
ncbi:ATP-dependent DNA helicase [Methylocapsa palsarum]|uniref:ATP-dependent exoDNAse (Exonuclease V), alpha subunit, helicase superfamily I n=1 Tax=Methylocapsa palsarum TaxID=1612308 RepID=A0A1I4C582_9HYPH|nr:AAA family ATPase [Methylocapsa palsarum]SFK75271.1 ATP-dependent exoDNAse (exonuclease V), alpha subunit, helicase superfamily I [Methylocapsa palsarum]